MPIAPEIDEEIVDVAPQTIAPPATVAQQAQVPAYANDVYQGPSTFKTFTGYQSAWEQAAKDAIAQRADDARFREVLSNATAVEDQLKAINQAKQFIQMRKFGSDLQAATASGLPPEQALAASLARNPGAVLGNIAASTSAFRNAGRAMQPQAPLGETKIITDPETGKRIGIGIRRGDGSIQFRPDASGDLTPSTRLNAYRLKAQILDNQIKNRGPGEDVSETQQKLKDVMGKIDKIIADEKAEIPNPVSQPTDKVKIKNKKTNAVKVTTRANAEQLTPEMDWEIVK